MLPSLLRAARYMAIHESRNGYLFPINAEQNVYCLPASRPTVRRLYANPPPPGNVPRYSRKVSGSNNR